MSRLPLLPRLVVLAVPMLLAHAVSLPAFAAGTPVQAALAGATGPADLRMRLITYANSAEKTDPNGAGEAWHWAGESWRRGANADSAIAAYRRANALRSTFDDRYALADALLGRQAPGDIDEGLKILQGSLPEAQTESREVAVRYGALLAWGKLLAGDLEGSRTDFAGLERDLTRDPLWRYRYGRAVLTGPDTPKAIQLLRPLAVASRGQSQEVMELLQRAAERVGQTEMLDHDLASRMQLRDEIEERVVTAIHGRRIKFAGRDRFPLSGVLLEATGSGRHRPAIVMMAPEDTLADFDSLGVALRESGFHTLLVAARGSGWSVGPTCPLPFTWEGREESLMQMVASDARDAVRATALAAKADTSGYVLVVSRSLALAGAQAAVQDRRVRALVLLSPNPDPVERGELVATLAKRKLPVFIQQTIEDYVNAEITDAAYHASAESASRVSDGHSGGHGAIAFKMDSRVSPRFRQWLTDALSSSPRPQPRKG
jgi:hypothetical protein